MKISLTIVALLMLNGCASTDRYVTDSHFDSCDAPSFIYAGTATDFNAISNEAEQTVYDSDSRFEKVLSFIDLPFSVLADTVILPLSVPLELTRDRRGDCSESS